MSKYLDSLEPDFKTKVMQLLQAVENVTNHKWVLTAGRRTMAEQRAIYAQGRTKPGKVVSNAPAGSSAHNFGYAVDLAPLSEDGKTINWNAQKSEWKLLADLAVEMGLTAGFYFSTIYDAAHIEDKAWKIQQAKWKSGELEIA